MCTACGKADGRPAGALVNHTHRRDPVCGRTHRGRTGVQAGRPDHNQHQHGREELPRMCARSGPVLREHRSADSFLVE